MMIGQHHGLWPLPLIANTSGLKTRQKYVDHEDRIGWQTTEHGYLSLSRTGEGKMNSIRFGKASEE
jgi:hypothetical protein